jgi:peptidoglycan/LPS O-acetylase OafA/YrhL
MPGNKRLLYIDNIRIVLITIVILHHLAITYGAPGGWYYREFDVSRLDPLTLTILVLFAASNQAYFMGFFFFLSGYFSAGVLEKRKPYQFLFQRLARLGIPILFFVYLISPTLRLLLRFILFDYPLSLAGLREIYQSLNFGIELGPMWFVILLLIFSFLYVFWNLLLKKLPLNFNDDLFLPNKFKLITYALLIGASTFLIRIYFPIGFVFQPLNLQVPFLLQYIMLFIFGITAYRGKWLDLLEPTTTRFWRNFTLVLIALMPALFFLSGGLDGDITFALGGFHWQSLSYALWEQLFCLGMIITLLSYFKEKKNQQSQLAKELASSSYAVYILHTPVLVIFTALLSGITLHPLIKIFLFALPVLGLCFLSASLIRRLPGFRSVL